MAKNGTKYMRLAASIRALLESGELHRGDRLYSEHALCMKFHVSRQTVRQALKELEAEGLIERRRGSGTYIAQDMLPQRKPTMSIGIISSYLDDYIFPSQTKGVERVLSEHGYSMHLGITYGKTYNEAKHLRAMLEKDVDGVLIEPAKSSLPHVNAAYYQEFMRRGIPILQVNTFVKELVLPYIAVDDIRGGYLACMHLIQMGHRRIGGVFKHDDNQGHLRYQGFMKALLEYDLLYNEEHVYWYSTEDRETLFALKDPQLLARVNGCTAVCCYNDQVALILIEQLRQNGKQIPQDVSVIGYDDSNLATVCVPALTSIVHPGQVLGELAAQQLLNMIAQPTFTGGHLFEPQLVERDSVRQLFQE